MSLSKETKEFLKEKCGHDVKVLKKGDTFKYNCTCCGDCCRNRDGANAIVLTMQDIFYLAKGLNMKITDFIREYTTYNVGGSSGLTVMALKSEKMYMPGPFAMMQPNGSKCTFLTYKEGKYICAVNDFKPSVCRIYPLGRITSSDNKDITYFLQTSDCQEGKSISESKTYSLEDWIPNLDRSNKECEKHNVFLEECFDIINFKAVHDSTEISDVYKRLLFATMIELWYGAFDTKLDFLEQFDDVKEKYFDFLKNLVSLLQGMDPSVKGKVFNDFVDEIDAMAYIAQTLGEMQHA